MRQKGHRIIPDFFQKSINKFINDLKAYHNINCLDRNANNPIYELEKNYFLNFFRF